MSFSFTTDDLGGKSQGMVGSSSIEKPEYDLDKWLTVSISIESEKVLSLETALECDQILKGDTYARLYFSGDVSKQEKYRIATEGIADKMAEATKAISQNMGKMIDHLVVHFKRHIGPGEVLSPAELQAKSASVEQILHEMLGGEALQTANQALHHAAKTPPGMSHLASAQELFSMDPVKHQIPPLTAAQADILATGEYTRLVEELLEVVDQVQPVQVLSAARKAYGQALAKGGTTEDPATLKANFFQLMAEPKKAHQKLGEAIKKIEDKHASLDSGHVDAPKDINHALRSFTQAATSTQIANYVRDRAELIPELERLRHEAVQSGAGTENIDHARDVFREMHGLLAVILKSDVVFQRFWQNLNASCAYLQAVMGQAELNLRNRLIEKGTLPSKMETHPEIVQIHRIGHALEVFRKRGG